MNLKTILGDSSASALSALVALKETLAKVKKPTDEVPTLKQVAKEYGLQERTIRKFLPYLLNKGFLEVETTPLEWVAEIKGKLTKELQSIINIMTEAALNAEQPESVNDDAIVKVKAVNSIEVMKKVYCLLPFILNNNYLPKEVEEKLDRDWLSRPLDKTRYKDQLKQNRDFTKKQKELQQEKATVQVKAVNDDAIEVDAKPDYSEVPEATKQKLNSNNSNKNKILQKKKQNCGSNHNYSYRR